ncbi:hypothetical protein ACH4M4_07100 [Streptomyces sp. NPDC017254]|uniref:hypothetical protein n=1 Tax=unclassified Streptomyces TaxID=2593676 RepID=UPI0037A55220
MSGYGGGARWNDETQSWETGTAPARPVGGAAAAPVVGGTTGPAGEGAAAGPGGEGPTPGPAGEGATSGPGTDPVISLTKGGGGGPVIPLPPPPPPQYTPGPAPEYNPGYAPAYVPETGGWQYSPPGAAAPAARPRARGTVAAGVAVAVLAAGSVGGWLLWGRDADGPSPAAGGPAVSVSAPEESTGATGTDDPTTGSPSESPSGTSPDPASPSGTAAPTDGTPPAGYGVVEDLKGFTIAVPDGWDRTETDQGVFYNAPDRRSLLQVFVVTEAGLTPYEALRGASEDGRANKPGYREISLERVTGEPGAPADSAELVYAYTRDDGSRRKVVDRAFTAPDGNHYAILVAGPEADWPGQRESLRVALEFFRPGAY